MKPLPVHHTPSSRRLPTSCGSRVAGSHLLAIYLGGTQNLMKTTVTTFSHCSWPRRPGVDAHEQDNGSIPQSDKVALLALENVFPNDMRFQDLRLDQPTCLIQDRACSRHTLVNQPDGFLRPEPFGMKIDVSQPAL